MKNYNEYFELKYIIIVFRVSKEHLKESCENKIHDIKESDMYILIISRSS